MKTVVIRELEDFIMQPIHIRDRGRGPELSTARITVFDVWPFLQGGWHPASIALWFDISSAEVQALTDYIVAHEEEVRTAYQKDLDRAARGNSPAVQALLQKSHELVEALREKLRRQRNQEANGAGNRGGH